MVMVKPATPYLDVIAAAAAAVDVPVTAYQVSGEYAMVQAAAQNGWIDSDAAAIELLTGIKRAGARAVLTYFAGRVAELLSRPVSSNQSWFERALRVIPGGVSSPVRSFRSVGGVPFSVERGEGAFLYDVEGRKLLDMVQSYGAVLLGHTHPTVTAAIRTAVAKGTTFGTPTPAEVLLAEAVCDARRGL